MMRDPEQAVAGYLAGLTTTIGKTTFSDEDRLLVRQHMLDAMASAFIGCRGRAFQDLAKSCSKIKEGCPWPGSGPERTGPEDAGMIWAFAINASVFEDGSREGACHPAAVVMPTVFALSQAKSWDLVDRAVISGYDVMVRLARSGNPAFAQKGFHPTSITAPLGAAATASILLGHDRAKTQHSLCLAALGSAGLMSAFRSGRTQPLQVAWAVRSGISAAMMAGAGHPGYPWIFEDGFYPAYLGDTPDPPVEHPLEHQYAIQGSYLKSYPGCRHMHPALDALGQILEEHRIAAEETRSIRVRTYRIAVETEIDDLTNRGDAYFNLPYAMAARLILGRSDHDAFDERHFENEKILSLMKKVQLLIDPEVDSCYPHQRGSIVELESNDGRIFRTRVNYPLGEPENPLSASDVVEKFRNTAAPLLPEKSMVRIEKILDVSDFTGAPKHILEAVSERLIVQVHR
jgi:2-methylcitrate dehydratase PrpD